MNISICYNQGMEFKDWITDKYIKWRGNSVGNERSVSEFARMLDVKQSILSRWMSGALSPGEKNVEKLSVMYPEIYDVLGVSVPEPFPELPKEWAERFFKARREYTAELSKRGMLTDSPEARQIIADAFVRHGINFTFTDGGDDDDN